ncbi:hypothetical protein VR5_012 [Escherichia phage vb_EcoM-VR5]|uniref:Transcriptional regulator n=1 Tax=Escherichia phage vb_EcoM-VR5 TaxID=1567026 RepID=A0A0A7HEY1_9CAUD|nr:hypothetical protein AVV69_gp012 [Escherichia phage vb_EcoM-VR5]AIZ01799.1 hypothetical protein VR5_012 [Escherichia phage vb_EcoM-VR5]
MKIYRVESSFSVLDDRNGITITRQASRQLTPYSGLFDEWSEGWLLEAGYNKPDFRHHHSNTKNIPVPSQDKLLVANSNRAINTKWGRPDYNGVDNYIPSWFVHLYHFAFASEYDMMRWFSREEREELSSKGFYLAVYEIPEDEVVIGDHQVMFRKSHAELVDFIEMRQL